MVRDTPTGRHQGEKNTPAPERLEQFTAGNCGKQDSPAGHDRGSGREHVGGVEKWRGDIHGMEMR